MNDIDLGFQELPKGNDETRIAYSDLLKIFPFQDNPDDYAEKILLFEFIFFTHLWSLNELKNPGIREFIYSIPLIWFRINSIHLVRWYTFIISKLVVNPLIVPPGITYKQLCEDLSFRWGTTIIPFPSRCDRSIIKNLIYPANDKMNCFDGMKKNYGAPFHPRIVIDTLPAPFIVREHTVMLNDYCIFHDRQSPLTHLKSTYIEIASACDPYFYDMFVEELLNHDPANSLLKVSSIFESLTYVFERMGCLTDKEKTSTHRCYHRFEENKYTRQCYDERYEILYLLHIWIAANGKYFPDGYYPLWRIVNFIETQRKWSRPMDERMLSRYLNEEDLIYNKSRRDESLKESHNSNEPTAEIGTEGEQGSAETEINKDYQLDIHQTPIEIPFSQRRHQVTYVYIDVRKLQKITKEEFEMNA